jgi:DNA mismatch repair protein MutL
MFLLVNNRWIKNLNLTRAILKGYTGALPQGRYPVAILCINVDPALIDVNIHPRKEEVKFVYEHKLEQLVQQAVKNALEQMIAQQVHVETPLSAPQYQAPLVDAKHSYVPAPQISREIIKPIFTPGHILKSDNSPERVWQKAMPDKLHEEKLFFTPVRTYRVIGECYNTYIVLEKDNEIIFVDQHAAHERILYELMIKNRAQAQPIALLFPQLVSVSKQALELLTPYVDVLAQYGIMSDVMGNDRFVIRQVPAYLKHINLVELINELVTFLQDTPEHDATFVKNFHDRLCIQAACKAAVKAGDELTQEKIYEILDRLETIDNRTTCPHGRPTTWVLRKTELEKKFRRNYTK